MIIRVLMENSAQTPELVAEHGLSLYIECESARILFDAGQSGAFADNAAKLGIDLTRVDLAVLSHGHYDHGGGLSRFLEINRTAPVYLHPEAFLPHFNAAGKDIGLDPLLMDSGRLILSEDAVRIAPGVRLVPGKDVAPIRPVDHGGMTTLDQGRRIPEDFRHEQYLILEEKGKTVCISGCSHRGILNIVHRFRPDVLVGGFHFMKWDPAGADLEDAARQLLNYPTVYYTGHCTGLPQYIRMKKIMGQRLNPLAAGTVIRIP